MERAAQAIFAGLATTALVGAGWMWTLPSTGAPAGPSSAAPVGSSAHAVAASTINRADYTGPSRCTECHEKVATTWNAHPHRRMNQDATKETVKGDFSGVKIAYSSGTVTFGTEDAGFTMTLERGGAVLRKFVVSRSVGSRFMQFYIGRQVIGPEPRDNKLYTEEHKLAFGYWFKLKLWLPVSYFDPVGAETQPDGTPTYDPFDGPRPHVWRQNCMLCHNTVPYLYRLGLPDGLEGFPGLEHQLAVQPLLADMQKTLDFAPRDGSPRNVKERIRPQDLVTLGISCEACHFGAAEHVKTDGNTPTSYLPQSPYLRWVSKTDKKPVESNPKDPRVLNGVCAQCHCATITTYPNGSGTWNSREALDLLGGACTTKIRCVDCHEPHTNDGAEGAPTEPKHVATCTKCHAKYQAPEAARAHSKHGDQVTCLECHMPRLTQGLEEVVRTHRISSPTERVMLEKGSGNACNLCHLDKPIGWTLDAFRSQFQRDIAPTASWSAFYGDKLEKPVGQAWLTGRDPSMRLVATQAYARVPELGKSAIKELIAALDDPIAVNRVFAMFAVGRVRGREVSREELDVTAPSSERKKMMEKLADPLTK